MSFTNHFSKEELAAVGAPEWHKAFLTKELFCHFAQRIWTEEGEWAQMRPTLLRLALAHPERAAMALGNGWSVAQWTDDGESTFTVIRWSRDLPEWWMLHVYPHGGVRIAEFGDLDIPQEFREALARADLISAAWQRIATQEATA